MLRLNRARLRVDPAVMSTRARHVTPLRRLPSPPPPLFSPPPWGGGVGSPMWRGSGREAEGGSSRRFFFSPPLPSPARFSGRHEIKEEVVAPGSPPLLAGSRDVRFRESADAAGGPWGVSPVPFFPSFPPFPVSIFGARWAPGARGRLETEMLLKTGPGESFPLLFFSSPSSPGQATRKWRQ